MASSHDGRFPGGPTTSQIVLDRKKHKCERLWMGNVDYLRKSTRYHGQLVSEMMIESKHDARRKQRVEDAGFGLFTSFVWKYSDLSLCFAIAERYWPQTGTFHFPFGEMCITLEDIYAITGLPIIGHPLVHRDVDSYATLITRCLGKMPEGADGVAATQQGKIRLAWLKDEFGNLSITATPVQVDQYTRAYLLALCGSCLFPNSTGNFMNATWLLFIKDLDKVNTYAWGAAVLSFLYRCLTEFVLTLEATDLRGFTPVLQVWSYEHFPSIGRPLIAPDAANFPLAAKYCIGNRKYCHEPHHNTPIFRQELDLLTADRVVWSPYSGFVMENLYSHRACLICLKTVHSHPVDRCMRQLGYVQNIPEDPIKWNRSSTGKATQRELRLAVNAWNDKLEPQYQVQGHRINNNMSEVLNEAAESYINWYGVPRMCNVSLRYEEPRYVPRGYGDRPAEALWIRCNESAAEFHQICEQFASSMGPIAQDYICIVVDRLRSPLPNGQWPLPQDPFNVPIRQFSCQQRAPTTSTPTSAQEPYVPDFVREERGEANVWDDASGFVKDAEFLHNCGMHTPPTHTYEVGASSSTQRPDTPTYFPQPYAPIDPTQEDFRHGRPVRNVAHRPIPILLCSYCSVTHRCNRHNGL